MQVGAVDTGVGAIEGIYVHHDHAFVGGFLGGGAYKVVDVSDPTNMLVVQTLDSPLYRQMVSEMKAYMPNVLFAALWDDPGGLATFDASVPGELTPLGVLARSYLVSDLGTGHAVDEGNLLKFNHNKDISD